MTKEQFLPTIIPLIVKYGKTYGYQVFSPIIAQAIIESNWGQSGLAKYNNFFGLKCGSKWTGASVNMKTKEEYKVGTLTTIKDNFRAYATVEDGIVGYFKFISTPRYLNLKSSKTPLEYCQNLKKDGYATSSTYVNTLMKTIETYKLTQYDKGVVKVEVPLDNTQKSIDEIAQEVVRGLWGNGNARKCKITKAGYDYAAVQKRVGEILKGGK